MADGRLCERRFVDALSESYGPHDGALLAVVEAGEMWDPGSPRVEAGRHESGEDEAGDEPSQQRLSAENLKSSIYGAGENPEMGRRGQSPQVSSHGSRHLRAYNDSSERPPSVDPPSPVREVYPRSSRSTADAAPRAAAMATRQKK